MSCSGRSSGWNRDPLMMSIADIFAFGSLSTVSALVIMEGLASLVLSFRDRPRVLWATGRKRSGYDPDLGWVNTPNTYIPNLYGSGRYLKINSQGFRNNDDFDSAVPEGRIRIICSGDSFTFGEGVANDNTWCQRLAHLDSRLEPVNLGQTGYGIDQAYLWYKRDGLKLSHQIHLLEFITDDFYRMQTSVFAGYAKPMLEVANGKLVVTNVPVPRRSHLLTWLDRNIRNLSRFRIVEFVNRSVQKLSGGAAADNGGAARAARNHRTREVLRHLVKDLEALRDERSIQPVLVYLPTLSELLDGGDDAQEWLEFLTIESTAVGIPLFDVMSEFRRRYQ